MRASTTTSRQSANANNRFSSSRAFSFSLHGVFVLTQHAPRSSLDGTFDLVLSISFYLMNNFSASAELELPTEFFFDDNNWLFLIATHFPNAFTTAFTSKTLTAIYRPTLEHLGTTLLGLFPSMSCMMKRHWAPIFHEQICHFCDRPRKPRPLIRRHDTRVEGTKHKYLADNSPRQQPLSETWAQSSKTPTHWRLSRF